MLIRIEYKDGADTYADVVHIHFGKNEMSAVIKGANTGAQGMTISRLIKKVERVHIFDRGQDVELFGKWHPYYAKD